MKADTIPEEERRRIVAELAMIDARDLANRTISYALMLRSLGGQLAECAANTFEAKAAELRAIERYYADMVGNNDN